MIRKNNNCFSTCIMNKRNNLLLILLLFWQMLCAQTPCPTECGITIHRNGKTLLVDSTGKILLTLPYTTFNRISFNESLAVVHFSKDTKSNKHLLTQEESLDNPILVPDDALSAVIDCYGNYVIMPTDKYYIRSDFKNGYAIIRHHRNDGFVNTRGETFYYGTPQYDSAYQIIFANRIALQNLEQRLNQERDSAHQIEIYQMDENRCAYRFRYSNNPHLVGIMKRNGEIIEEPSTTKWEQFDKNGLAFFSKDTVINGKRGSFRGMIDTTGARRLQTASTKLIPAPDGMCMFYKDGWAGLFNEEGKVVYQTPELIDHYSEGLMVVRYNYETFLFGYGRHKLGLIDTSGHTVVKPKFEYIGFFQNGLAEVRLRNGKVGYINRKGEYVFRPKKER